MEGAGIAREAWHFKQRASPGLRATRGAPRGQERSDWGAIYMPKAMYVERVRM
jgi:hypothetical protein